MDLPVFARARRDEIEVECSAGLAARRACAALTAVACTSTGAAALPAALTAALVVTLTAAAFGTALCGVVCSACL